MWDIWGNVGYCVGYYVGHRGMNCMVRMGYIRALGISHVLVFYHYRISSLFPVFTIRTREQVNGRTYFYSITLQLDPQTIECIPYPDSAPMAKWVNSPSQNGNLSSQCPFFCIDISTGYLSQPCSYPSMPLLSYQAQRLLQRKRSLRFHNCCECIRNYAKKRTEIITRK